MPLSKIQIDVLRVLASHRDPEIYVGADVGQTAEADGETLRAFGYELSWLRREEFIYSASLARDGGSARFEWIKGSDLRFFSIANHGSLGYALHPLDLAIDKIVAAAVGRRRLQDIVDLSLVHESILPLGAVVWAAVEKTSGFTPEGLLAQIRRNSNYPRAEWTALATNEPVDPVATMTRLRRYLDEAEAFVAKMPTEKAGLLFLQGGKVVQPDPNHLEAYETHHGQRRGHWPSSGEISSAMLERYQRG